MVEDVPQTHTHTSVEGRRKPGKLRGDHHREIPKKERGGHGDRLRY